MPVVNVTARTPGKSFALLTTDAALLFDPGGDIPRAGRADGVRRPELRLCQHRAAAPHGATSAVCLVDRSYFNIEVATLPGEQILAQQEVMFFGVGYAVPVVVDWPGTIVAVNVGGALIPSLVSLYLLIRHDLWMRGVLATACVTAVCHAVARPVPGLGIALPTIVPTLTAAIVALLLSRSRPAPLAYIGGSLGTLIGADLLNLGLVRGLGAPVASIGGAGTFDGFFSSASSRSSSQVSTRRRGADRFSR